MARQKVSEREYLDASGNTVDAISAASGARYSLGQTKGDQFEIVKSFDCQFGEPGQAATLFAIMGFHTKLGNVANSVLNDKDAPGTPKDAADAVGEFFASAQKGVWREPGTGVGGARYDVEVMADAIAGVTGKPRDGFLAKMSTRVDAKGNPVSADSEGNYPKGSKTYPAFAYSNPLVRQAYDKAKGTGTDINSL